MSLLSILGTKTLFGVLGTKLMAFAMAIAEWVTGIFDYLTSALKGVGDAILGFIKEGFVTLFLKTTTSGETTTITGISEFGIFAIVMLSISLVIGLTYFITNLVRRKL